MKLKAKFIMIALSAGSIALQFGNCGQFWGDTFGDLLWLQVID